MNMLDRIMKRIGPMLAPAITQSVRDAINIELSTEPGALTDEQMRLMAHEVIDFNGGITDGVINMLQRHFSRRPAPAPKPTKQDAAVEAVREVLAPYRNHSRLEIELSVFEDVVAAARKADREAHNG